MSSLVLASVQKALYTWIKAETQGVIPQEQIAWRQQSEPLPPRPCVTLKITDGPTPVGALDHVKYISSGAQAGKFNIGGQRTMVVSIQVFGNSQIPRPRAYQLAMDLHQSLSKMTTLEKLRSLGVAVQDRGQVQNISALEETEHEERAQFDVLLGLAGDVVDDPGVIDRANVTPIITGP